MPTDPGVRAELAAVASDGSPDAEFDDEPFRDAVDRVGPGALDAVEGDHFGPLYEDLADGDRTDDAPGRVYTPPEVGRILARWAVRSPDDRVLDPCCGTGAITVEAYRRLTDLGCSHPEALDRITAVDVDGLAVRLAALSLAARDPGPLPDGPVTHHADFFDLDPESDPAATAVPGAGVTGSADGATGSTDGATGSADGATGSTDGATGSIGGGALGRFDATVANPPYLRQEAFADERERIRAHLARFGPDGATPYLNGDRAIDRRSDLYCYFLTRATEFLRPGGRLAWIVPTKWMTADYGPSVRRFLHDHYRVAAVVGIRGRVFDDALVDAVLLLAERRAPADDDADDGDDGVASRGDDGVASREGVTNFVRVGEGFEPETVVRAADADPSIPEGSRATVRSGPGHRTVAVCRSHLAATPGRKLDHYLDAPAAYVALVEREATVELGDLATVTRGKKTGANPIFVLDREDVETHGVEARFRRPAVKSVREVEGFEYTAADAERWFLDVHDYVEGVVSGDGDGALSGDSDGRLSGDGDGDGSGSGSSDGAGDSNGARGSPAGEGSLERAVRDSLRADGHEGLLSYLDWAADRPARSNATLADYDPWFDVGDLAGETAPILCPQAMDTRRMFLRSDGEVAASNRFLLVDPDGHDPALLLGLLNASLGKVVVECHGRVTGGGAVNCSASDLRSMPVVDPEALAPAERERIAGGFETLADGDRSGLDAVDRTLVDALDLDVPVERLRATAERLKRIRRGEAGTGDVGVGEPGDRAGDFDGPFGGNG